MRALRNSVINSGTSKMKNRLQIHAIRSGSSAWKTAMYFLSRSKPGMLWAQTGTVRLLRIIDVMKSTILFDRTAHDKTIKKVNR